MRDGKSQDIEFAPVDLPDDSPTVPARFRVYPDDDDHELPGMAAFVVVAAVVVVVGLLLWRVLG